MIQEWVSDNLPHDSIIIEAGTCNGVDTVWLAEHCCDGHVYGFEPVPELYEAAVARTSYLNNVTLYQKALGPFPGYQSLYISDRYGQPFGSSSLLLPQAHLQLHPEITFKRSVMVEVVNLDNWLANTSIKRIGMLWLDMQGLEPILLRHAPQTLAMADYIYTEVSLIEMYAKVELYPQYRDFLHYSGFKTVFEDLPWTDMGNALFKRSENENSIL